MKLSTESESGYNDLEMMSVSDLLHHINEEDRKVPAVIAGAIPAIEKLVEAIVPKIKAGGRLIYLGAGTSGRLGIVDASECPPTYGVPHGIVIGIIAGGDTAIRYPVEFAEDNREQGWKDLQEREVNSGDVVIGIAASGHTPYVVGALEKCRENGIVTGCITCNSDTPLSKQSDFPVEVVVGPEFVTGSTRMKAGTAQKLVLNMISTSVMIRLGRVKGNKMVDMQLTNNKLVSRGTRMLAQQLGIDENEASILLEKAGSVRKAIQLYQEK